MYLEKRKYKNGEYFAVKEMQDIRCIQLKVKLFFSV